MFFRRISAVIAVLLACSASLLASAQSPLVPNGSFQDGGPGKVSGWTLSGGNGSVDEEGARAGARSLVVRGTGDDANFWLSDKIAFEPMTLYVLRFSARHEASGVGAAITGPPFCNRDYYDIPESWKSCANVFLTPATLNDANARIRFGQWHVNTPFAFSDVRLNKAVPAYAQIGDLVLGDGERIDGNQYSFYLPREKNLSNHCRPVALLDCSFNTSRYVFGKGSKLVFKHELPGRRLLSGTLSLTLGYHQRGKLEVDCCLDGENWERIGETASMKIDPISIPSALLPAKTLWVRLRDETGEPLAQDSDPGSFSVSGYTLRAEVDGPPVKAVGVTRYVELLGITPGLELQGATVADLLPGADGLISLSVNNKTGKTIPLTASIAEYANGTREKRPVKQRVRLEPGQNSVALPYSLRGTGLRRLDIDLGTAVRASCEMYISDIFNASYGESFSQPADPVGLWWAESGWKVSKSRPMPAQKGKALQINLAQNEVEAAQLVVTPRIPLTGVRVECGELVGPANARIPGSAVEVLRVGYVDIVYPSDYISSPGLWPDPLLPIEKPFDLLQGENHPLWIRVKTSADTPPGDYTGEIALHADDGYSAKVPLRVHVYGFALPKRMTCATLFGADVNSAFRYQNVTDPAHKRIVLDKYFQCLADHHISPYNPAPLDPFTVKWPEVTKDSDPSSLKVSIDWSAWDGAMEKAFNEYHFNAFRIPSEGMGHKTSLNKEVKPSLLGFGEDSPIYQALFTQYWSQMQEHLREKGWITNGYLYWFDEPEPAHYPFVRKGIERFKKVAPDISVVLTEQPEPALYDVPDVWCVLSDAFTEERAEERRAAGDRFWWYVCTAPKAPYATLFIDHPGAEMRVWLWQTWQRGIEGVLIWQTLLWSSPSAYPDSTHPQNPYEDPMSWQQGAALNQPGRRVPYGNGDGRFLYPPLAAADGRPTAPVLEGPVESFRLEMLRDGIEDYEYLAILKRLLETKKGALSQSQLNKYEELLRVPADISKTVTEHTVSPKPIELRRDAIARAIETLMRQY